MNPSSKGSLIAWTRNSVQVNFHVKMCALLLLILFLPLEQLFSVQLETSELNFVRNVQSGTNDSSAIEFFKIFGYLGDMWVIQISVTVLFYLFDPRHSVKLAIVACYGVYLSSLLNMMLREPRPYFLSSHVTGYDCAEGFGMPALGLTVATVCYSFMLVMYLHRRMLAVRVSAYIVAFSIMVLLGASKVILGSNFPHQVVTTLLYDYIYIAITLSFDTAINKLAYHSSVNYEENRKYAIYWFIGTLGCLLASLMVYLIFPLHYKVDIQWVNNTLLTCETSSRVISVAPLYQSGIIFYLYGIVAGCMLTSRVMPTVWWRSPLWKQALCILIACGVQVAIYFALSKSYKQTRYLLSRL